MCQSLHCGRRLTYTESPYRLQSMKALVLQSYNDLQIMDVPKPVPQQNEVLIRVRSAAICGSDVHGYDGTSGRRIPPVIMGHEASGVIEAVGSQVTKWKEHDAVTFDSTIYHLDDWFSRKGMYNLSDNRRVLGVSCDEYRQNGAFAEYVVVPEHICYAIPETLDFDAAALTEPMAVALHGVSLTPRDIGDTVLVIGAGLIGLLTVAVLHRQGCANIVVSDISERRLELARAMGATETINPSLQDVGGYCRSLTSQRGADAVIDAVGLPQTVETAIAAVRRGGTVTLVGNISQRVEIPLQRVVAGQIRLQGSCAICGEYPAALQMLSSGSVPLDKIISVRAPLEEAPELFKRLHSADPDLIKVVLHP